MGRDFTKIKAWQFADDLAVLTYKVTRQFPREEIYGLTSQLRRAASSAPANIAEGSNRISKKDYLHFLSIASGSLAEVRYFLHLSKRLGYISAADHSQCAVLAEETSRTLTGLISSVQREVAIRTVGIILAASALTSTLFFTWRLLSQI
jgi:four helix bundle protein